MADAVAFYRGLVDRRPDSAPIWASFAQVLFDDARHDEALEAADAGIAIDPSLAQLWLTRGGACKALHRFAAAADAFRQADRYAPGRASVLLALGTTLIALGWHAEAEDCLHRAIARDPTGSAAHASLGSLYVRQGRFDEAEAASRYALALAPDCVVARRNLAGVLARSRPEEARIHRDAAYGAQQIFIEPAARPDLTVLVPCAADAANVPLRALLPPERRTLINWFIEYAPPGQELTLPPYDLVFNGIGDADFAISTAAAMDRFLAHCPRPLLNHPARVARTGRSDMATLYAGLPGVMVPRARRLPPGQEAASAGLALPLILRPIGSHGGEGMRLITTPAELARGGDGGYLTEFIDYRDADDLYRKYRAIFVDRVPYPYHLAISSHWLVHYWTAGMAAHPARREEEARFLADPAAAIGASAMAALAAIGARLDLDYAGIDFAILPDGRLLVFEANATMLVHPEDQPMFAYKNPAVARISEAFAAMVDARLRTGVPPASAAAP